MKTFLFNPDFESDVEMILCRVRDAYIDLHLHDAGGFTTRMGVHRARSRAALPLDEGGRGRYPSGYV